MLAHCACSTVITAEGTRFPPNGPQLHVSTSLRRRCRQIARSDLDPPHRLEPPLRPMAAARRVLSTSINPLFAARRRRAVAGAPGRGSARWMASQAGPSTSEETRNGEFVPSWRRQWAARAPWDAPPHLALPPLATHAPCQRRPRPRSPAAAAAPAAGDAAGAKNVVLVVAVALIDAQRRVLLAQRPEGRAMAGLWEFPGGKASTATRA